MKIIWTEFAIINLKEIYDYYVLNVSKKVADKIRSQIFISSNQLIKNINSGPVEDNLKSLNENYRYLVSGNYKLIYKIDGNKIIKQDIFDVRQNPPKMNDEKRLNK